MSFRWAELTFCSKQYSQNLLFTESEKMEVNMALFFNFLERAQLHFHRYFGADFYRWGENLKLTCFRRYPYLDYVLLYAQFNIHL